MQNLKWDNLLLNKCPKCNRGFTATHYNKVTKMFTHPCGFKITELRFKELTTKKTIGFIGEDRKVDL